MRARVVWVCRGDLTRHALRYQKEPIVPSVSAKKRIAFRLVKATAFAHIEH